MNSSSKDPSEGQETNEESSEGEYGDRMDTVHHTPQHTPSSSATALIIAASDKAGMQGIDRRKIDSIILRESGDSAYMQQQRKRDQTVDGKIKQLRRRLEEQQQKDVHWKARMEQELEDEIATLLSNRSLFSTCVVVDLDMFYVNCELLSRPHLRDVPTVVGTSMILTSNYCARQYGVRSAMAGWIGDKLVEELSGGKQKLVHIPANFQLYTEKSQVVRSVMAEYDPQLRAYSLDEAYLNIGPYLIRRLQNPGYSHEEIRASLLCLVDQSDTEGACGAEVISDSRHDEEHGEDILAKGTVSQQQDFDVVLASFPQHVIIDTASKIVTQMRVQVQHATGGLTCSAGLAPNFMLAKIASDFNKPDGQKVIGPAHESVMEFVHPLLIRKIPGVGRVTEKQLHAFGVQTVRELYEHRALVRFLFQPATSRFLLRASLGVSSSSNISDFAASASGGQKGISRERTFASGRPWSDVMSRLEDVGRLLSSDMVRKGIRAHTLTVKVKFHTFDVLSKSRTLNRGVFLQSSEDIVPLATELLMELRKQHAVNTKSSLFSVRLLGIRCSNFQGDDESDLGKMNIERFLQKQIDGKAPSTRPRSPTPTRSPPARSPATIDGKLSPVVVHKRCLIPVDDRTVTAAHSADAPGKTDFSPELQNCPMCQQLIPFESCSLDYNSVVNCHLDSCLNASAVREAVREESRAASERQYANNKKPRLTDFFRVGNYARDAGK